MDANGRGRRAGQHAQDLFPARTRLRTDCVEDTSAILLEKVNEPGTEVADIDPLERARAIRRSEHVAAARKPIDPVRETIRVVAGPDDVSRSHDGGGFPEDLTHGTVAVCLERPVVRPAHLLGRRVEASRERRGFHDPLCRRRVVHRGCGDEQVATDASLQQLRRIAHVTRHVARIVDHRIPSTCASERRETGVDLRVTVTDQ